MLIKPHHRIHALITCLVIAISIGGCTSVSSVVKNSTRNSVPNDGTLYGLIANQKYENAMDVLTKLYENFPNSARDEYKFTQSVDRVAYHLPKKHEQMLKSFILKNKNSIPVQYLEARYVQYTGTKARGGKPTKETPKKNMRTMRKAVAKSIDLYNLVLYKDPTNYLAHARLAESYTYIGKEQLSNEHFETALDYSPTSFGIWDSYLFHSRPRWGGSHEKMDDIIFALEAYENENPNLKRLKGLALADKADFARRNKQLDLAERYALAALEFEPHKTYGQTVDRVYQAVSRSGDTVAACRISKKVNSLYPKNKRYQKLIEEC